MYKITDKINILYGTATVFLAVIFGKYWFLFIGFLALNTVDYFTGILKAKFFNKNESSSAGAKGIVKKVSYWVVIGISFFISVSFAKMGELLEIDLGFVILFGWLTLATYMINEMRSILENLVEMDVKVPEFLLTGLEVAENAVQRLNKEECEDGKDDLH